MANKNHRAILRSGVDAWNLWRNENPNIKPDLSRSSLREADFSGANFSGADLTVADLRRANLSEAFFTSADFRHADFSGANLSGAHFTEADLRIANLHKADLRLVNLSHADLSGANLSGADFCDATIAWTTFGNVDLSEVKGLETVKHNGPSTIGIDTIYKSKGNIPHKFLLGAGVPQDDIGYLLSLAGKAIDFYSCFISHSSKDKDFVERIHADLQAKGVRCWYAPEDLKIGEPFLLGIDRGIRLHDKLLLVLSEQSVASGWVQHEVLAAMAKEQGKPPWVLFPIRLDNAVMETSVPWANMIRDSRHIGDFTHWKDHDSYQQAFDRLMRDLQAES